MKSKLTASLLWLAFAPLLAAQTTDDYVRQGRAYLAVTDLNAANRCFSNAVARSPNNETANVLYAATRLLILPYQQPTGDFLTRLGIPDAGRNIYNWTAVLLLDGDGAPYVPTGVNASELTEVLRTNILYAVVAAEANLAKVTATNFTLALSASETRTVGVTLDYGDIQMLRAGLRAAEYCIYNAYSWNLEAELTAIRAMFDMHDPTTLEEGLIAYPQLLTFATTNDLNAAKLAFQNGVDRYLAASLFIRSNRPPDALRLFNYDPEVAADEEKCRRTLAELRDSITGAVTLSIDTNYTAFLGAVFNDPEPPRSFLPCIRGNGFGLATLPDPTFGGAVYGLSSLTVDQSLAKYLQPIPTIGAGFNKPGGRFEFSLNLAKNRGYVVQVSTNLSSWTDSVAFFASDWTYNFSDPNIGGSARRFYRVADRTTNMPPPTNDDFTDRIAIPGLDVPVSGYNVSATIGPGESSWTEGIGQTVWWSWTSTMSGEAAVVAAPSKFVGVFTGTTLHGLVQIASGWGQVNFTAQPGTTYQILVDSGWYDPEPTVRLVVSRPPTLVVNSPTENAEFYSPASVVIAGLAWDPSGQVPKVTVDGSFHYETNANSFSFLQTNVPGGHYYLSFSVINSSGARAQDQRHFRVRPLNDMFSNAIPIVGSPLLVTGSNRGADREADEPYHDGHYGEASIWWSWTPTNSGSVTIACALSNGNYPYFGVYTGDILSDLTPVASAVHSNGTAMVQFTATAEETYKIAVDSYSWREGDVYLGINCPALPPAVSLPLALGVAANNLFGTFDSQTLYKLSIPSGLPSLHISISGGTGDCDLYVRHGWQPTLNDYDYAPFLDGNDETVSIPNPVAGDWYIMLHGFDTYSGVTLLAQ
jgi:hypothetical protein